MLQNVNAWLADCSAGKAEYLKSQDGSQVQGADVLSSGNDTLEKWLKSVHYVLYVEEAMISNAGTPFAEKDLAPCE